MHDQRSGLVSDSNNEAKACQPILLAVYTVDADQFFVATEFFSTARLSIFLGRFKEANLVVVLVEKRDSVDETRLTVIFCLDSPN